MKGASTAVYAAFLVVIHTVPVFGATPFQHGWGKVSDMMGMHAAFSSGVPQEDIEFVASHYATITTAAACSTGINATHTIEEVTLDTATRIKNVNPDVTVGMYWRSDFVMEIEECSWFADEWLAHPEWRLKMDNGTVITRSDRFFYIDYSNPDACAFYTKVLVNVSSFLNDSGAPILDYVYIDGDPALSQTSSFLPGIGPARSQQLVGDIYNCFGGIQSQLDERGFDQKVVLNGMDDVFSATIHRATGAAASMFDHWTILQFLHGNNGSFVLEDMDAAIALASGNRTNNFTLKIKGWPGPIIQQRDQYPPNIPTPTTTAEFQAVAEQRFNSELAFFLLVAESKDFWVYSWFWRWYDYVPNNPASTVPPHFFPEAACAIGAPNGPYRRTPGTWIYTREFEHASVYVDLTNRTACKVSFDNC